MSGRMLTGLAQVLRDAGLTVVEYGGWQHRARSSGGFEPGKPWGVMWHHTASQTTPENDASYMCHGSPDAPIANLLIARDGVVWVLAAGGTNTNGKGGPVLWSRGAVPKDAMNTYAVGMEIANNGVGEQYPAAQIDAAFTASLAMLRAAGLQPYDVCTHQTYAPDRKIDPAVAENVQGDWQPERVTGSGSWSLVDLIDEHERRWAQLPPGGGGDMGYPLEGFWRMHNDDAVYAVYAGGYKVWLADGNIAAAKQNLARLNGVDPTVQVQSDVAMFRAFGPVLGAIPPGRDTDGVLA